MYLDRPPRVIDTRVFARMPDFLRRKNVRTAWANANRASQPTECFLEGPTFDRDGNLYLVDIPFGRIFRVSPALEWSLVAQYDGWPNGLAMHRDGALWIADYRRGLLRLDLNGAQRDARTPAHVLGHRNSESFRGLNDLTFDAQGRLYFTDQGQTGLHDPSGRVYRYDAGRSTLELVVS